MADLLGEDSLSKTLADALAAAGIADAEIAARRVVRGFARYSANRLDQHAEMDEQSATVRVSVPVTDGARIASASTADVSHDGLVATLHRARDLATRARAIPDWPGFAPPEGDTPQPPRFAPSTARCNAAQRADLVARALDRARTASLTAAGILETSQYESAVANTRGTRRYTNGTTATFKMFALDADGTSGFAQSRDRDVDRLEVDARATEACEKSLAGRDPIALPAGDYDVILEPSAVCELLEWLAFVTFGGREVLDGNSAIAGRTGELVTGEAITLVDDACDASELGFGTPFDREGTVRERVTLIDKGRACAPVYDRLFGSRAKQKSTGHAAPAGGMVDAPVAQSIHMAAGSAASVDELIAGVDRGLYVTRLHYVNGFLDPRRTLMTGLTRDGTFLVEGGKRTRGVRNMRFTDSVFEAFARADGLTALRTAVPAWWTEAGAFVAPAMRIRALRFTGGGVRG